MVSLHAQAADQKSKLFARSSSEQVRSRTDLPDMVHCVIILSSFIFKHLLAVHSVLKIVHGSANTKK